MNTILVGKHNQTYLECLPDEERLDSESKALDLVAACGENETSRLLVHAASLTEDFFQLKTGLAGAIMLKLSNYRIRWALILAPERATQGRFGEMVLETNRWNQFRVFPDRESAENWLLSS
jgi:PadR family transcriptional regulator AphA